MTTWLKVRGDVKDTIVPVLSGVENLANVTSIEGHVWRIGRVADPSGHHWEIGRRLVS